MMAEQITFRCIGASFKANKKAVRFYPNLYLKKKLHNDKKIVILLYETSVDALKIIVDWINRHQDDPERTIFESLKDSVEVTLTKDDEKSLRSVDNNVIFEIVQAADEYDMMDLLDGACQIAAPIIENMSPAKLKAKFFVSDNEEEGYLSDDDEL